MIRSIKGKLQKRRQRIILFYLICIAWQFIPYPDQDWQLAFGTVNLKEWLHQNALYLYTKRRYTQIKDGLFLAKTPSFLYSNW